MLVVDGKGDISCALLGEIMATQAEASGIAGIIIDGAVRDADALAQGSYPVFAAGLNPSGPTKSIPGRVNHPVSVAGASIEPGDLLVGDADGVVVIAKQDVERIIARRRRSWTPKRAASRVLSRAICVRAGWKVPCARRYVSRRRISVMSNVKLSSSPAATGC